MPDVRDLEALVTRAREGEAPALEELVTAVRDEVYNLAVRMLWHPEDAEDATQEILLKVVTKLSTFRGLSSFRTWVFRIAANHLLNIRRSRAEREELSFEAFGRDLSDRSGPVSSPAGDAADQALLVEEVKVGCTQGMLLCLDREQRLAYILGEVFELRSEEAAIVLGIEPAAFRKRLSRARERLRRFMRAYCGLVSPEAACSCERRLPIALGRGRVDPEHLLFAGRGSPPRGGLPVLEEVGEMERLQEIAGVFQSHPGYTAPEAVVKNVRRIIDSGRYRLLS